MEESGFTPFIPKTSKTLNLQLSLDQGHTCCQESPLVGGPSSPAEVELEANIGQVIKVASSQPGFCLCDGPVAQVHSPTPHWCYEEV